MYVLSAGHGRAFGVSYDRIVNVVSGIPERRTDIYGHVCMDVFSGIGVPLMEVLMQVVREVLDPGGCRGVRSRVQALCGDLQ